MSTRYKGRTKARSNTRLPMLPAGERRQQVIRTFGQGQRAQVLINAGEVVRDGWTERWSGKWTEAQNGRTDATKKKVHTTRIK